MADLGRWFKLWCSCVGDPGLDNLPIADFGRWAKLGAIIKEHGTEGTLLVSAPARSLCASLQLDSFDALIVRVSTFPHVTMRRENPNVSCETNTNVSYIIEYCNWPKYQGDFSTPRVRQFREKNAEMKRSKRREEERRREENKKVSNAPPPDHAAPSENGFSSWPPEWDPIRTRIENTPILLRYKTWLTDLDWWKTLDELFTSAPKNLDTLLVEAAAYIHTEGYRPRNSKGLRMKLRNCLEFSAKKAERDHADQKRSRV